MSEPEPREEEPRLSHFFLLYGGLFLLVVGLGAAMVLVMRLSR